MAKKKAARTPKKKAAAVRKPRRRVKRANPKPRRVAAKRVKRPASKRANPAKLRKVGANGTGWISASAVKIVKQRGKPVKVLIRKPRKRRKA